MKLPVTTEDYPYIEFRIDTKGKIKLSTTNKWWGGKNEGFVSSDGTEGNSCKPEDLEEYIKVFQIKEIKRIEKRISLLQEELKGVLAIQEELDKLTK